MGPISRYLGPEVPTQRFIWQDPLPTVTYSPITAVDEAALKAQILAAHGVTVSNLVSAAWGSASTFRGGDKRGGANGARIALQPQVSVSQISSLNCCILIGSSRASQIFTKVMC
jgi:catalase-peroxidase